MKNNLNASVPFLMRKIHNLVRGRWATKSDFDSDEAVGVVSENVQELIDNLSYGTFEPPLIRGESLPNSDQIMNAINIANDDINDIIEEGTAVGNLALQLDALIISSTTGILNKIGEIRSWMHLPSIEDSSNQILVFTDRFNNNALAGNNTSTRILNGKMTLSALAIDNVLDGNIANIEVLTNGDAGNAWEIKPPEGIHIRSNNSSSTDSILEEESAEFWSDNEPVSANPAAVIKTNKFFEIGCVDLQNYQVPVRIISPFKVFKDTSSGEPLIYGDAIVLNRGTIDADTKNISIFEYTGAKDIDGKWENSTPYGYGWQYDISEKTAEDDPNLWIGPPGSRKIVDINDKAVIQNEYDSADILYATVTINLKQPVVADEISIKLGDIKRTTGNFKLPELNSITNNPISVLTKDGWINATPLNPNVIFDNNITAIFDRNFITAIRVMLQQPHFYNTYIGHPYILSEMNFTVDTQVKLKGPRITYKTIKLVDDYRFIIRYPTDDNARHTKANIYNSVSQYHDVSGSFFSFSQRISGWGSVDEKIQFGYEPFPAKRWAIRIDSIGVFEPKFDDSSMYESILIESPSEIKSLWIETQEGPMPNGASIEYFIRVSGVDEDLPITPRNSINNYDGITTYIFDNTKDIGYRTQHIKLDDPVTSAVVKIKMEKGNDPYESPTIYQYKLYVETYRYKNEA
jgi:hypothetical protein